MDNYGDYLLEYKTCMILKNYSPRTIKTYYQIVDYFLRCCRDQHPDSELTQDIARDYILWRYSKGLDWQTINSDYSSIQKFFKNILLLPWSIQKIPRPRKEKKLPSILSKEDVTKIIEHAHTYKHQVMLTCIYVTGMRLSEAIHLKIEDIDGHRCQIRINKGKGNKDRFVIIPTCLILLLRDYYKREHPLSFMFPGIDKNKMFSSRSVQLAMHQAKKAAKITKKGSIHTLRNCYATHHLEGGTDLVFLQEQMGHKNLNTTIRYIGLCVERHRYIRHPIDSMQITYRHPMA